jgi:hypothetical protein
MFSAFISRTKSVTVAVPFCTLLLPTLNIVSQPNNFVIAFKRKFQLFNFILLLLALQSDIK